MYRDLHAEHRKKGPAVVEARDLVATYDEDIALRVPTLTFRGVVHGPSRTEGLEQMPSARWRRIVALHHDRCPARALLALDGLSVGDAFGQRVLAGPEPASRVITRRILPRAPWRHSDDTAMACALVEHLATHGADDRDALAVDFARRYRDDPQRGYGAVAHWILTRIDEGMPWREAARTPYQRTGSMGNGAAMRVAPVAAWFADDAREAVQTATASAEVTHAHPEGIAGAVAVAAACVFAWRARRGPGAAPASEMLGFAVEHTPGGRVRDGLREAARRLATTPEEDAYTVGSGSGCSEMYAWYWSTSSTATGPVAAPRRRCSHARSRSVCCKPVGPSQCSQPTVVRKGRRTRAQRRAARHVDRGPAVQQDHLAHEAVQRPRQERRRLHPPRPRVRHAALGRRQEQAVELVANLPEEHLIAQPLVGRDGLERRHHDPLVERAALRGVEHHVHATAGHHRVGGEHAVRAPEFHVDRVVEVVVGRVVLVGHGPLEPELPRPEKEPEVDPRRKDAQRVAPSLRALGVEALHEAEHAQDVVDHRATRRRVGHHEAPRGGGVPGHAPRRTQHAPLGPVARAEVGIALGDAPGAERDVRDLARCSNDRGHVAEVELDIAAVSERAERWRESAHFHEAWLQRHAQIASPLLRVRALAQLGDALRGSGDALRANAAYGRAVAVVLSQNIDALDPTGERLRPYLARARFWLAEPAWRAFMARSVPRFGGSDTRRAYDLWVQRVLTPFVRESQRLLNEDLTRLYTLVVNHHISRWEVAANQRLAAFARWVAAIPPPPEVRRHPEIMEVWCNELDTLDCGHPGTRFLNVAAEGFRRWLRTAEHLRHMDDFALACEHALHDFDRGRFPLADELTPTPDQGLLR